MNLKSRLDKLEQRTGTNQGPEIIWVDAPPAMTLEEWERCVKQIEAGETDNPISQWEERCKKRMAELCTPTDS